MNSVFAGKWYWLVASCVLFGCSLTPTGLKVGKDALTDAQAVLDTAEDTDGDGVVGTRELVEAMLATGFGLNFLRNRKYKMVRKPSEGSEA